MDYKERMKNEYKELKAKYTKLHKMIILAGCGKLDFKPKCPLPILAKQCDVMAEYLYILEERAEIEGIDLDDNDDNRLSELLEDWKMITQ